MGSGFLEVDPFRLVTAIDGMASTGDTFKQTLPSCLYWNPTLAGTDPIGTGYMNARKLIDPDAVDVLNRIIEGLTTEFPDIARGAALEFLRQDMDAAAAEKRRLEEEMGV